MTRNQMDARGMDPAAAVMAVIRDLTRELHPNRVMVVDFDTVLDRELGIDSLSRVELIARIEREFAVNLREDVFGSAETVGDLVRAVAGATPAGRAVARAAVIGVPQRAPAATHEARTLVEVFAQYLEHDADAVHLHLLGDGDDDRPITHRELHEGAARVAAGLQSLGVAPGDRVVIMLPTCREYFLSFLGILLAGGVPVPIYPPTRGSQIEDHLRRQTAILDNCAPAALITTAPAVPLARLMKSQTGSLRGVVTVDELVATGGCFERTNPTADAIAFLQYTSGSTGNPKGVVLTHRNVLANIRADGARIGAHAGDVFVSWLPLYHDMGLIGAWLGSVYHGITLIVMPPTAFLTRPRRWLWAIHRYGGTLSAAPNFAYELCVTSIRDEDLEGLDLSSWRIAFNGAEPVSANTIERFSARFARYGFAPQAMYPVYGLAECTVGLAFPLPGREPVIDCVQRGALMDRGTAVPAAAGDESLRFVASGPPLDGHEIRVVDGAGRELPERHQGRLQFRGPSATRGYFRNAAASRALLRGAWLESGDLAYIADGNVFITGRVKDVIIRGGRNLHPQELEEILGRLPGVRAGRVAVLGSVDPRAGTERLIVLAETRERDATARARLRGDIIAATTDFIAMPPDEVVLVPAGNILRTSSGKLRRADMCRLFEQGALGTESKTGRLPLARLMLAGLVRQLCAAGRALGARGYALYCWGVFCGLAVTAWAVVPLLPDLGLRWRVLRWLAQGLVRATATPLMVSGSERVPDGQPCIFVANHSSYLDSFVLVAALPGPFSFIAKAELAAQPALRWFLRSIRTIYVERFDPRQALADATVIADAVSHGHTVLIYPEGTFGRAPGLLPFRMGAFVTAAGTGTPIVPVAVRGTRSMLRSGAWFPRRGQIAVTIGAPIHARDFSTAAGAEWALAMKLRVTTRDFMLGHCGEPDLPGEPAPAP